MRLQFQSVRRVFLPFNAQTHACAVEETTRMVQPSGAYRVVMGENLVANHQWLRRVAVYLPRAFIRLHGIHALFALKGSELLQVFNKFPYQVAAWNPYRQRYMLRDGWLGDGERHLVKMRVQVKQLDAVVNFCFSWGFLACHSFGEYLKHMRMR